MSPSTDRTIQADLRGADPDRTIAASVTPAADAERTLAASAPTDGERTVAMGETPAPRPTTARKRKKDHTRSQPKLIDAERVAQRIGNYEIVSFLGEGGMGTVFKARHKELGRISALKVIHFDASNQATAEQFLREARLAAAVEHPNLVTLYDFGRLDDILYMSMRFIDGGDVDGRLKREGVLQERDARGVMLDATRALEAIHRAGLIHRDIKPGNLFLDGGGIAYLGDLGLACLVSENADHEGSFAGTPAFTSPEQAQGQALDIRTDIYSLGAVYYTMATASRPFEGKSPFEVLAKVVQAPTPDPRRLNPTVSNDQAAVIMRAMAKDRSQRYATPNEMLDDLMALAEGRPLVHTRTAQLGEQPQPRTSRYSADGENQRREQAERERRVTVLRTSGLNFAPMVETPQAKPEGFARRLLRGLFGR